MNPDNLFACMLCKEPLDNGMVLIGESTIESYQRNYEAGIIGGTDYADSFERMAIETQEEFDAEIAALGASIDVDDLLELGKHWCMTCMNYANVCQDQPDQCECESNCVSFFTVDDQSVALLPYDAYIDGGGCKGCVFEYTVECDPYLLFLKEWVDDEDCMPEPIGRCDQYLPSHNSIDRKRINT